MTGKTNTQEAVSSKQKGRGRRSLPAVQCLLPSDSRGFTLLELMIVISIIIILAAVTLPQYQKTVLHTRETILHDDLYRMRSLIDQFAADKGKLPQSLEELVSERYLREIPIDPITEKADWTPVPGEDPNLINGGSGLADIHSSSQEASLDGSQYSQW